MYAGYTHPGRTRPTKSAADIAGWRFGHRVSRRPWPYMIGAVVALLALATLTLWIQTAFPAAGDAPTKTTQRQAYDLLAEGFGTGINASLTLVVDLGSPGVDASTLPALTNDITAVPGVVSLSQPTHLGGRRHRRCSAPSRRSDRPSSRPPPPFRGSDELVQR